MPIRLENISKSFQTAHKKVKVLNNINLEINDKDIMVIFGPSGIGKTTLLNLIGGMDKPTTGKIVIDEVDIFSLKSDELARMRKEKMGFIFQSFNLIPNLTAKDNIILPILLDKDRGKKIRKILKFAKKIGIEKRLEHLPSELSVGEQQRVAIARAIANSPSIIIADEPTADLDDANSQTIINILKKDLNQKKDCTVLIASNDKRVAGSFSKRFDLLT